MRRYVITKDAKNPGFFRLFDRSDSPIAIRHTSIGLVDKSWIARMRTKYNIEITEEK